MRYYYRCHWIPFKLPYSAQQLGRDVSVWRFRLRRLFSEFLVRTFLELALSNTTLSLPSTVMHIITTCYHDGLAYPAVLQDVDAMFHICIQDPIWSVSLGIRYRYGEESLPMQNFWKSHHDVARASFFPFEMYKYYVLPRISGSRPESITLVCGKGVQVVAPSQSDNLNDICSGNCHPLACALSWQMCKYFGWKHTVQIFIWKSTLMGIRKLTNLFCPFWYFSMLFTYWKEKIIRALTAAELF